MELLLFFFFLTPLLLPKSFGALEAASTSDSTLETTTSSSSDFKDPWPRILVAQAPDNSRPSATSVIYIQAYDIESHTSTSLSGPQISALSTPSLSGSIDGRICFSLASVPYFACYKNNSISKPTAFTKAEDGYAEYTYTRVDLSPDGNRLLYLKPTGKLVMTFLNKGGDAVEFPHLLQPASAKIENFAIDWYTGVLATTRSLSRRVHLENWRILEIITDFESANITTVFRYRFENVESAGLRLTLDVEHQTLYVLYGNGSIGFVQYESMENLELKHLYFRDGTEVQIAVVELKYREQAAFFAHEGHIYYLRNFDNELVRLNVKTLETETAPFPLAKMERFKYTQVALDTSTLTLIKNNTTTCDHCSHRCFPKYPQDVVCDCPIGSLDSTGNRCVSNETLMAIWRKGKASPVVLNLLSGDQTLVNLTLVFEALEIVPLNFVKLWSPSSNLRRFCVLCRTKNKTLKITCHLLKNPEEFVPVPVTIPIEVDEGPPKVVSVTEEGNGSRWIVTWIDLEGRNLLFRMSSEPNRTLTLSRNVFEEGRDFSIDGSTFLYTFLARIHGNTINYFDRQDRDREIRSANLIYLRRDTQESLHVNLSSTDPVEDIEYQAPFSPTSRFGDICFVEQKWKPPRQYRVKCLLNNFKNVVFHESSGPIQGIAEQTWIVEKPEVHDCFTGLHNCSHLCRPHMEKMMDLDVSDPVHFIPGYTCLCPWELPILLQGRQCSFRLIIGVKLQVPGSNGLETAATVWKVSEEGIKELPNSRQKHSYQYNFNVEANLLCRLDAIGVVCGKHSMIPGSHGAAFLVQDQLKFFANEVYWVTNKIETSAGGLKNINKHCVFLGASEQNTSICLGCLELDFQLSKDQIAVDSHRKLIFWARENKASNPTIHLGRISSNGTIVTQHSYKIKEDPADRLHLNVVNLHCDALSMFIYVGTNTLAIFRLRYSMANDDVYQFQEERRPFKFDEYRLNSGAFVVTIRDAVFTYDKKTTEVNHIIDRYDFFPVLNVSNILNLESKNFEVTGIQSAYTAKDLNASSPCFDDQCEYFCQVVQSQHGNVSRCLCPSNSTAQVSDLVYCSDLGNSTSFIIAAEVSSSLAISLSIGLFIFILLTAVLCFCLYVKHREKAHLKRVIQDFKEGDASRAEASKDEAEKAQYLPFKAIIAAEDLTVDEAEILGEGNFGTVFKGMYSGQTVAVKTTKSDLDPQAIEDFLKELKIMEFVGDHSNIVRFHGAEISKIDDGRVLVVLELCPYGNLLEYLWKLSKESKKVEEPIYVGETEEEMMDLDEDGYKRHSFLRGKKLNLPLNSANMKKEESIELFAYKTFTDSTADVTNPYSAFEFKSLKQNGAAELEIVEEDSKFKVLPKQSFYWASQIASGLEFLESKNVVHGDMAARNVLVFENGVVKVSDFGFSKKLYQSQIYMKKEACQLPMRWAAPETILRHEFSSKADVWSFGVTMWEIFTFGDVPFYYCEVDEVFYDKIIDGRVRLRRPKLLSEELYEQLLLPCWQLEPEQRVSFASIRSVLDDVRDSLKD